MGTHKTTAGKVKLSLALDPRAYELLREMASGPRAVGALLADLIFAEAGRQAGANAPECLPEEPIRPPVQAPTEPRPQGVAQSPAMIAEAAAHGILRGVDAAGVAVGLCSHPDEILEILAAVGIVNPFIKPGSRISTGAGRWHDLVRSTDVVSEDDLMGLPEPAPDVRAAIALGIRSQTILPLLVEGRPIGLMSIARTHIGPPADEDLRLARQVADSLAVALHSARLLQTERQARRALEALHAASAALTRTLDFDAVLESLLDSLADLIPYDSANVMLRTSESLLSVRATRGYERWTDPQLTRNITFDIRTNPLIGEVFRTQGSLLVADTSREPQWVRPPGAEHVQSWLAVPLIVGGVMLGIFSVDKTEPGFFDREHVRLAEALAPQAAVAIQNARLYAEVQAGRLQLQRLSRQLVEVQEAERRSLSRDLHDTSGQSITALKLGLGSLRRAKDCSEVIRARVDALLELTESVSEDLHRLAVSLRPSSLDRYGLVPALEQLLTEYRKQTGSEVAFLAEGVDEERLAADIESALYRIVQEATTNCARYAQAAGVSVIIRRERERVQVIVEDDGRGFDVTEALQSGRLGLLGMRERAEMLGGTLEIESNPDRAPGSPGPGTTIYVSVPLHAAGLEDEVRLPSEHALEVAPLPPLQVGAAGREARPDEAAELARAKALSDTLVEITAAIAPGASADQVLRLVLGRSAQAIGCDNAYIAIREAERWDARYAYRPRPDLSHLLDVDTPAFNWVARTRQVLVVADTHALHPGDPLRLDGYHVKSYACIPLLADAALLGVMSFVNYSAAGTFHPSEVEFLHRLASIVTLALENARLHEIEARQRDELAQRVGELETLLELLPVGVAIAYDPAGQVIRANPANARLLGMPQGANVSLNTGELPREADYRVYQDGRELSPEELPMQRAVRGQIVRDMVVDLVRGDGTSVILLSSAVPLLDAEGRPRGAVGTFVDITELRRAQSEAEEARWTLEALMDHVPEGITIAEAPDARIRYVSRYGRDLLGGPHQDMTASQVADRWTVYYADGQTPMADEDLPLVRAMSAGEVVRDREIVQVNAAGRRLALLCNAGPIRDREGKISGGVVAWRDIAALKEAQQALQGALTAATQNEAHYRALFESMTEGFAVHELICDAEGQPVDFRFLTVNPAFERSTGLKRAAVEGRLMSEIMPVDGPYLLDVCGRVVLTGTAAHFDNFSQEQDKWYDVYAYRPEPGRFAVIFMEITDRKRAEEQVRQLNDVLSHRAAELQAILDAIADGLMILDETGKIIRMNRVAAQLTGYTAADQTERIAKRAKKLYAFKPDGQPYEESELPSARALRGLTVQGSIMAFRRPEGTTWISASAAPIVGPHGARHGAVATLTDITHLHDIQEALQETAEELEVTTEELQVQSGELSVAAATLEQRVRERTAELSILHEIDRSILAAHTPAEIARLAVEKTRLATHALGVSVSLFDAEAEKVLILASTGADGSGLAEAASAYLTWQRIAGEGPASGDVEIADVAAPFFSDAAASKAAEPRVRSILRLSLKVKGQPIGYLSISRAEVGRPSPESLDFAEQVADSLAVAIHNARLNEQVRASRAQLQALARRRAETLERDHRYVADQLYNEAGQVLASLKMQLGILERRLAQGEASADDLAEMKHTADLVLHDLHDLATRLRPVSLDRLGLAAALEQYLGEFGAQRGLRVQFTRQGMERLRVPDMIETALYRIAQEALANVAQHARAERVSIALSRSASFLVLSVTDDGVGFDLEEALRRGALGLLSLRERTEALGGSLAIDSAPGRGTCVTARVPIPADG